MASPSWTTTPWPLSKFMILFVFLLLDDHAMLAVAAGSNTDSTGRSTLAALGISGNLIAIFNCLYPIFTFVIPVWKEGSVRDRMVYGSLLAFSNNLMWAMYAASDSFSSKLFFFIVNGVAFVCQLFYSIVYIYYAEGRNRIQALLLLFVFCGLALLMAILVSSMVMTQKWSSDWVGVLAAISGVSMHIFSAVDMVIVMKSKRIIYIDRVITAFASLAAAYIWTVDGFISAPVNFYVVVPNLVGILSATTQTVVYSYLITRKTRIHSFYTDDAVDYSYEMGKLFASSPV